MGGAPKVPERKYIETPADKARLAEIRRRAELERFQSGRARSTLVASTSSVNSGTPIVGIGSIQ